ncbi:hypothetical protein HDV05_005616 [Chytridiales sp. JEL 0842]|nr:hypothetical protein HDV05_005616 [Chytridiales sp. JEL 0842]
MLRALKTLTLLAAAISSVSCRPTSADIRNASTPVAVSADNADRVLTGLDPLLSFGLVQIDDSATSRFNWNASDLVDVNLNGTMYTFALSGNCTTTPDAITCRKDTGSLVIAGNSTADRLGRRARILDGAFVFVSNEIPASKEWVNGGNFYARDDGWFGNDGMIIELLQCVANDQNPTRTTSANREFWVANYLTVSLRLSQHWPVGCPYWAHGIRLLVAEDFGWVTQWDQRSWSSYGWDQYAFRCEQCQWERMGIFSYRASSQQQWPNDDNELRRPSKIGN